MDRLLKVDEAATLLGSTPGSLYRKAFRRDIPSVKIGKSLRFRLTDLERLIEAGTRPARLATPTREATANG